MSDEIYRCALESITPGGSEFHKNPEGCVAYIRTRLKSGADAHRELVRIRGLIQEDEVGVDLDAEFLLFNQKIQGIVDGDGAWEWKYDYVFTGENRATLKRLRPYFEHYDPDTTYQEDVQAYANALDEEAKRVREDR